MVDPRKSNDPSGRRQSRVLASFTVSFSFDIIPCITAIASSAVPRQQITSRVARGNFTPRPSRIRTGGSRLIRLLGPSRRSNPDLPEDQQVRVASRQLTQPVDCVA